MSNTWADGPFNPSQKLTETTATQPALEADYVAVFKKYGFTGTIMRGQKYKISSATDTYDLMNYQKGPVDVKVYLRTTTEVDRRNVPRGEYLIRYRADFQQTEGGASAKELDADLKRIPELK